MPSKRLIWLLALFAALALVVAACEPDDDVDDVDDPADEDVEEPADEPDDDDVGVEDDEDVEDDAVEDEDAVEEDDEDLTPAEGETILDVLAARTDEDAPDPGEEDAEAEEEEEPEEPEEASFSSLLEAVEIAELEELLESEGPFTVFGPTDEAFALFPADSFEELVADPERLDEVLGYHIVEGEHPMDELEPGDEFDTVSGQTLTLRESEGGDLLVEGAPIVEADIQADNGVVHGIGAVLLAPAL